MDFESSTQQINDFISSFQLMNVAVIQSDENQRHNGILYKYDGECKVIHLAWHYFLKDEPILPSFENACCVISQLEEHRQYAVCAMCDLIKDDTNIPYGIFYQDTVFNENGKLTLGAGEVGLTCATFVLAVFRACKIDLLDACTWPSREDDIGFHDNILTGLEHGVRRKFIEQEHFDKVKSDRGCIRFRPEEVAICSGFEFDNMPVSYEKVSPISIQMKNKLESEYTPT